MLRIDPHRLSKPERILWRYGITEPGEIDLEAIAFDLGAVVRYRRLDGCDARIVGDGSRAIITVNTQTYPVRQRFSIAHELGHWIDDRGRGGFLCAREDIGPQNAEVKTAEPLANRFASQLILPDYLFGPKAEGKPISLDVADTLAKEFNASLTATAIKLVKRSCGPAAVICHGQANREWVITNISFPSELWIQKELHSDTDGFALLYGSSNGKSRLKQEPASRWLAGRDSFRLSVRSQSVKLADGTALSVIALAP